jgi:hypothetical protein
MKYRPAGSSDALTSDTVGGGRYVLNRQYIRPWQPAESDLRAPQVFHEPGQARPDDPPVAAQPLRGVDAFTGDPHQHALPGYFPAQESLVVGLVRVQLAGPASWCSPRRLLNNAVSGLGLGLGRGCRVLVGDVSGEAVLLWWVVGVMLGKGLPDRCRGEGLCWWSGDGPSGGLAG